MKPIVRFLLLLAILTHSLVAIAQGTAFTYQGELQDGADLANGNFDISFKLFTNSSGGVAVASVTNLNTAVANGLFTSLVSFPSDPFTGGSNWLEIAIRTNGASPFSPPLTPRQLITPTPYANFASTAANAATATTATSAATAASATTANGFSGSLLGDVTGTENATQVSSIAGQTAASLVSGASAANAASSANTASALVKRDASGNFSAGTITANLSGNATSATSAAAVTGNIPDAQLSANVARLNGTNVFTGTNRFSGILVATNVNNIIAGSFTGNLTGNASTATTASSAASATSATTATTANNFSGSLSGDVTGTQSATTVAKVGGTSATTIAAGASLANAATSANTASALVKRDASGNFSAGTVTADLFGNATTATTATTASNFTGNVADTQLSANVARLNGTNVFTGTNRFGGILVATNVNNIIAGSFTGNLTGNATTATTASSATSATSATTATTATSFSGNLSGDVTGTQSATTVAKVGGATASTIAAGASLANAATSANTASALVKRDASGNFSAGTVSASGFSGNGNSLSNLNAYNLTGPVTFQQNATSPNTILGYSGNSIAAGVTGSVITGGGWSGANNIINDSYSMIGSGEGNTVGAGADHVFLGGGQSNLVYSSSTYSFMGAGFENQIGASTYAFIGAGQQNVISAASQTFIGAGDLNSVSATGAAVVSGEENSVASDHSIIGNGARNFIGSSSSGIVAGEDNNIQIGCNDSFIGGGLFNSINGQGGNFSFIGCGESNQVQDGFCSTVPGGLLNIADGYYSFAAGQQAQALHQGAFVWADSQNASFASTANDQFLIRAQGGVGIGTTSPGAALEVNGDARADGEIKSAGSLAALSFLNRNNQGETWQFSASSAGVDFRNFGGSAGTPIHITETGKVGIGTATPSGGLDVETSAAVSDGSWGFLQQPGYTSGSGGGFDGTPNIAIFTSGSMGASTYYAFSDEPIKNVIGLSSSAKDLNTLMGIRVTDFTYKDKITKGDRPVKKVIAQQVESVYPQAVSKTTGCIPDIYQQASLNDGWIQLSTDLKKGDYVKIISNQSQGIYEVLETAPGRFRVDLKSSSEKIFVFGRQVDDFRNVDYEAISMLNVSATQELSRKLDAQSDELAVLKEQLTEMKKLVAQVAREKPSKLAAASFEPLVTVDETQ